MSDVRITFICTKEVADRLDRLAKKADMNRSRLVSNMVDEFSKTLELSGKVGILQLSVLIRNCGEKMSEWAKNVKKKKVDPLD